MKKRIINSVVEVARVLEHEYDYNTLFQAREGLINYRIEKMKFRIINELQSNKEDG